MYLCDLSSTEILDPDSAAGFPRQSFFRLALLVHSEEETDLIRV